MESSVKQTFSIYIDWTLQFEAKFAAVRSRVWLFVCFSTLVRTGHREPCSVDFIYRVLLVDTGLYKQVESLPSFGLVSRQEQAWLITMCMWLSVLPSLLCCPGAAVLVNALCIYRKICVFWQKGVRDCTKKRRVMKMRTLSSLMPWRIPLPL